MVPALILYALQILLSLPLGNAPLDRPLPVGSTDDLLQYDDGSAYWLTWSGLYRGTWFNQEDFGGPWWNHIENLEYWFYHHSSYPWDSSSFIAQVYSGGPSGPASMLGEVSVMAVHYAPCYADLGWVIIGSDFWGLVDTELSSGGWPSLLGDDSPQPEASHSFYSDDFVTWQPWIVGGSTANDFFIRAEVYWSALDQTTWGSIKTLF